MKMRRYGEYPNLRTDDILLSGSMTLWRNLADKPFGEQDGYTFETDWQRAAELTRALARLKAEAEQHATGPFAWDPEFGFLSPIPAHCGTGLEVEGCFHLEGLHLLGDLPSTLAGVSAVRFCSCSVSEDGINQAAHLFRIHNDATLGVSEDELLARAQELFSELVLQEHAARRSLVEDSPRILEDAISRALALLRSSRLLAPGEVLDLLSPVRLGVTMGFLDGLTRTDVMRLMDTQMKAPPISAADATEEIHRRDDRDAALADRMNARFAKVHFNQNAEELLF